MERLQERVRIARQAFTRLQEVLRISQPTDIERDAATQRFEFTFEAIWKAAKQMLFDIEGIDVGSPKGVIRSIREIGLFDETETILALEMVDDRNLTVHTYNEALSKEIYNRILTYETLLLKWLNRMEKRL